MSPLAPSDLLTLPAKAAAQDLWRCGVLTHGLAGDLRLDNAVLAQLVDSLPPDRIEYNDGRLAIDQDPTAVPNNGRTAAQTLADIDTNASWMVLKGVEQHALLAPLVGDLKGRVGNVLTDSSGPEALLGIEAFLFVSSPHVITPFHSDPEHNLLLQIRGSKTVHTWPCTDRTVVPWARFEATCAGAHRNLPYQPAFEARAQVFSLSPGDGLYMPPRAPHWVENGPEVSVSLSFTWRSRASERERKICMVNAMLRRAGLPPQPAGSSAWRDACKLGAGQVGTASINVLKRSPRARSALLRLARSPSGSQP